MTGACCLAETQDLTEDDIIRDQHGSADLIDEADRCQQLQGSGFDDDADLHEAGSQAYDSHEVSQQPLGSAMNASVPNNHKWSPALLLNFPSADSPQHCSALISEQAHLEKISAARQAHDKNRGFHHALQQDSRANANGYQSMHGHPGFFADKIVSHFASSFGAQRPFRNAEASENLAPAAVSF